jgi:hypothetical protein
MAGFRAQLPKLTDRIPLGASGLEVSPVCIGITLDPMVVPAAFEAGINFFFLTADLHWPLYEDTRRGLKQLLESNPAARDSIVVAVAAYVTQPEFLWLPFEEVLMEVPQLDHIDLTIAGGSYGHELPTRLPVFVKHRETKYVGARAIGASFHDRKAAVELVEQGTLDLALVRYNPLHPKTRTEVFDRVTSRADGRKTLLYNFKSTTGHLADADYARLGVADEFWRPHVTDYYRFVLMEPALDGLLCALPSPHAVGELADALARGPLDEEDHQYLLDLGELERGKARVKPGT